MIHTALMDASILASLVLLAKLCDLSRAKLQAVRARAEARQS